MIRIGTIVWFVILAMLGIGLFQVKYAVQSKERELRMVNRQITADREAMRVLDAEWSYLNDPVRLADLTRRHTDLAPVMAGQIATFESLAPRQVPPADAAPGLPPMAAAPGTETAPVAVPTSAVVAAPAEAVPAAATPANDPIFQTSAGKETPAADDDATIRAILADMQSNQGGDAGQGDDTAPAPATVKNAPANEAGVE